MMDVFYPHWKQQSSLKWYSVHNAQFDLISLSSALESRTAVPTACSPTYLPSSLWTRTSRWSVTPSSAGRGKLWLSPFHLQHCQIANFRPKQPLWQSHKHLTWRSRHGKIIRRKKIHPPWLRKATLPLFQIPATSKCQIMLRMRTFWSTSAVQEILLRTKHSLQVFLSSLNYTRATRTRRTWRGGSPRCRTPRAPSTCWDTCPRTPRPWMSGPSLTVARVKAGWRAAQTAPCTAPASPLPSSTPPPDPPTRRSGKVPILANIRRLGFNFQVWWLLHWSMVSLIWVWPLVSIETNPHKPGGSQWQGTITDLFP